MLSEWALPQLASSRYTSARRAWHRTAPCDDRTAPRDDRTARRLSLTSAHCTRPLARFAVEDSAVPRRVWRQRQSYRMERELEGA
jgi:hypothetical protein